MAQPDRPSSGRSVVARADSGMPVADGLDVHGDVRALDREWDALADRAGASPFLRPGWAAAWWDAFGRGELRVFALRDGGRLAAVLPMSLSRGVLRSTTNWHTPHFAPLAEGPAARDELLARLFGGRHRRVDLGFLLCGTDAEAAQSAAARAGRLVDARTLARSPFVATDEGADDYPARLSKNRRKSLRRQQRRLDEAGVAEYGIGMCPRVEEVGALLDEAFRVEASGWKGRGGTAIASDPATARFYDEISRWAAARGLLRLSFLRLDGEALAFDLSIADAGAYYSLKAGYAASAGAYGPGVLLLHELVLWAHAGDVEVLELLGGEEDYKRDWATGHRELLLIHGFSRSPAGRLERAGVVRARPAAKAVRTAVRRVLR